MSVLVKSCQRDSHEHAFNIHYYNSAWDTSPSQVRLCINPIFKKENMTEELRDDNEPLYVLELTTKIVTLRWKQRYSEDFSCPGIVISWIPKEGYYYGAVNRYIKMNESTTMYSVNDKNFTNLIRKIAKWVYEETQKDDELTRLISDLKDCVKWK